MKRTTYISLCLFLISLSVAAQTNQLIKVEGIARISEIPQEIIVSVDLSITDSIYQDCFNESLASLNALKKVFKHNGIDPKLIKSKAITVNENYDWHQNKRVKTGYISNISLEVKGAFTQKFSQSLLKSLDQKNLNINYNISFGFSEEQKTTLRKRAIELAVADAKEKAETIALAANLKLIGISAIKYGSSTYYEPMDIMREADFEMAPMKGNAHSFAGVDLNPKEQHIQKSIFIEWAFE